MQASKCPHKLSCFSSAFGLAARQKEMGTNNKCARKKTRRLLEVAVANQPDSMAATTNYYVSVALAHIVGMEQAVRYSQRSSI